MSVPLTDAEKAWLRYFTGSLNGDRHCAKSLDLVIPPRIRTALQLRLDIDRETREWQRTYAWQLGDHA